MEQLDLQQTVIQQHQRIQELEARENQTAIDSAIGIALDAAGVQLHPGARDHIAKLMRPELALVPDASGVKTVRGPGLARVDELLKSRLAGDYSHFIRGGGSGFQTQSAAAQLGGGIQPAPRNLGEHIIQAAQVASKNAGDPRYTGGTVINEDGTITRQRGEAFGLRPIR